MHKKKLANDLEEALKRKTKLVNELQKALKEKDVADQTQMQRQIMMTSSTDKQNAEDILNVCFYTFVYI